RRRLNAHVRGARPGNENAGKLVAPEAVNSSREGVMRIARWDPFRELEEMSTRLNRFWGPPQAQSAASDDGGFAAWAPAIDVEETDAEYLVKADLPAMKKEDVKVCLEDGILAVEGE